MTKPCTCKRSLNGNEFGSSTSPCYGAEGSGSNQTTCVLFAITPTELKNYPNLLSSTNVSRPS